MNFLKRKQSAPVLRDWGHHSFCYFDWHMTNTLTVYFSDAPMRPVLPARHETYDMDRWAAIKQLQADGWQEIISAPYNEGSQHTLMRTPIMEAGFDYLMMTVYFHTGTTRVEGMFRLGKRNESLLMSKPYDPKSRVGSLLPESEHYLIAQRWERVSIQEYAYENRDLYRHELHLYRRKARRLFR